MGKLEKEALLIRRRGYIERALLTVVAGAGLLLVTAAAPNVLQVLDKCAPDKYKLKYRLKNVTSRLAAKGQIRFVERDGKNHMEITEKGRRILDMMRYEALMTVRAGKRWDRRWRMVVFDIPERYRHTRDKLRTLLRSLGFVPLQASVWVYPYDCEEIVGLVKADLGGGAGILYAIVEKIEKDERLKQYYSLR